jgi:hypothetical protein
MDYERRAKKKEKNWMWWWNMPTQPMGHGVIHSNEPECIRSRQAKALSN